MLHGTPDSIDFGYDHGERPFPAGRLPAAEAYRADLAIYPRQRLPVWLAAYLGHDRRQIRSLRRAAPVCGAGLGSRLQRESSATGSVCGSAGMGGGPGGQPTRWRGSALLLLLVGARSLVSGSVATCFRVRRRATECVEFGGGRRTSDPGAGGKTGQPAATAGRRPDRSGTPGASDESSRGTGVRWHLRRYRRCRLPIPAGRLARRSVRRAAVCFSRDRRRFSDCIVLHSLGWSPAGSVGIMEMSPGWPAVSGPARRRKPSGRGVGQCKKKRFHQYD